MSKDEAKDKPDRFANLGPPGIARRFVRAGSEPPKQSGGSEPAAPVAQSKRKIAKAALATAEAKPSRKHAGGRPAKIGKPWEGVCSRAEWYRRRRAK